MTRTCSARLTRRVFVTAAGAAIAVVALPAAAAENGGLEIWFIRHAESEINVAGNPRTVPDSGISYPLTQKGVEQARALAQALSSARLMTIYASTTLRAVQTADALAFSHGLALQLAPEAVEINLGTLSDPPEDSRAIYSELARKWTLDKDIEARHRQGESFADLQRRFLPFVREIMNRHAHDRGVVVIVSHSATLGLMVPALAANVPADFALRHPVPNTGIIKTELRDSRLFCTDWLGIASDDFEG